MSSFVAVPKQPKGVSPFLQALVALLIGLGLFIGSAAALTMGYRLLFTGRIFPGVSMAGVDLSSMTPGQASAALSQKLQFPQNGRIVLRYGTRVWVAKPADFGMVFDVDASVQRAYNTGRAGGPLAGLASQLNAWQGGLELSPVIILDERASRQYLENIAREVNQPLVETNLHLEATQVLYTPGQTGRLLNVDESLGELIALVKTFTDGEIPLVVEEQQPVMSDAADVAAGLRTALTAPLTLTIASPQPGDPGPWTIDPASLAGMIQVGQVQDGNTWKYKVSLDSGVFDALISQIKPQVEQMPQNARFYFDDPTGQLVLVQPSKSGRTLNVDDTRANVLEGLLKGQHSIPLALETDKPDVGDDATAASLGITKLVSSATSYFRGSGTPRLQNIRTAAEKFYGLLIPPNTTFSMGEAIGDISLDNGYAEALIIYNGQSIAGVGGGVCQVSTTLFRTAFFGGYPIVERHYHAYRVFYYEQTANGTDPDMAGLDATVYFPLVDLKFTNDRPYWLLMETYFDPAHYSLTWKFYSGDDGRQVDWQNLGLRNVVKAPSPRFEENPDLGADQMKQVEWPGDGADITVSRSVTRNGTTLFTDNIQTSYEPWQAVCQYGPGTQDPAALAEQLGICQ